MTNFNSDPQSIGIAVTTYYPKWYKGRLRSIKHTDKVRGDLAIEFAGICSQAGYKLVVADGNSSKSFKRALSQINGIILIKRRSMKRSPSKRLAIKRLSKMPDIKVIILSEPEKVSLIKDCLPTIIKSILDRKADIVIPKRNQELFKKTYPSYQYDSETEGNNLYNEILKSHNLLLEGENFDMFFGPNAFLNTSKFRALFLKTHKLPTGKSLKYNIVIDPEEYSNTIFFPIVLALKKKFKVKSVEVPFSYPMLQKQNEEKGQKELFLEKRKNQKLSLLVELLYFLRFISR